MNWKKIRKKQIKIEILYISLILACFAIGIICEYRVMHKTYRLTVDNYDAISLAILQIQATIQTLTIALLALTTSHMTKQYMGINYNDFLFNRKPVIFTQKRIIVVSLISLAVNLFIHMSGFYNLVTAIFLIACLLIIASVHQIYAVFSSSVATEEESKHTSCIRLRKMRT